MAILLFEHVMIMHTQVESDLQPNSVIGKLIIIFESHLCFYIYICSTVDLE